MQTTISPETLDLLKASGWYPDRSVDIEDVVSKLEEHHFEVYPAVQTFLKEFYGIKIEDRNPRNKGTYHLIFDPLKALSMPDKHLLRLQYERDVSGLTCPIGVSQDGERSQYFMDKAGRVYEADYHSSFGLIGDNVLKAIDYVLKDRPQELLYVLAPFNDFRIYDILTNLNTVATVGHTNSKSAYKGKMWGYNIDRFLRDKGYDVYTIQPQPENIDDKLDDNLKLFSTLADVPKSIEILVCLTSAYMNQALKDAQRHHISILFPSFPNYDPEFTIAALAAGVEHIENIGIREAYEFVVEGDLFKPK